MKFSSAFLPALALLFSSSLRAQSTELNPDAGAPLTRLDFLLEPGSGLDRGGEVEFFQARLGVPVFGQKVGEDWIWGLRTRYEFTSLEISGDPVLENELHRLDLGPSLLYRPENSPWRAFFSGTIGLATDFSDVNGDDVVYSVLAAAGYKFSDRFTLLFGAYYSQDFGDARLFPGVGFVWNIADKWTASLLPPRVQLAYAPTENWRIALEGYPDGDSWSVESATGEQSSLERKALRAGLRVERRITENGWIFAGAGWAFGRELRLEGEDSGRVSYESDVDDGAYFSLGISLGF
jgi:hypothetical protein